MCAWHVNNPFNCMKRNLEVQPLFKVLSQGASHAKMEGPIVLNRVLFLLNGVTSLKEE